MAKARSSWRALRPVFLAGAATLTWLTFSSPAASADVLSDTTSLLGGVGSSVSSATDKLAGPAPAAPPAAAPAVAAPAAGAPSPGLLRPVVGQVSGLADNIVAAVPVVNQVVPAGAVTAVSAPIVGVADGATAAVVDVVVPPVAGAVPVLEPVVEPVADLVTGTKPLPVAVPDLTVVPVDAGLSDGAALPGGSSDLSEGAGAPTRDEAVAEDSAALSESPTLLGLPGVDAMQGPVPPVPLWVWWPWRVRRPRCGP